jgi:hypothetical protein
MPPSHCFFVACLLTHPLSVVGVSAGASTREDG